MYDWISAMETQADAIHVMIQPVLLCELFSYRSGVLWLYTTPISSANALTIRKANCEGSTNRERAMLIITAGLH